MDCTSCGVSIDHRAAFCPKCGEVTLSGQPLNQKIANALFQLGEGLGKVVNAAMDFVTEETNRNKMIGGGVVFAFLLIALTENPISNEIAGLFEAEEPELELTDDGLPDFANYADIFLSEEKEFFVMGKANVRDYPTSQGTQVIKTLAGGETILAREVKAFDPSSQWFKLANGGYVWGGNLLSDDQIAHEAGYTFPSSLQGQWSNKNSCADVGRDTLFSISETKIDFGATRYDLVNILSAGNELPGYQLAESGNNSLEGSGLTVQEDARWPVIWISYDSDLTEKAYRYFRSDLPCSEVLAIAERMSR
ncbi:zinc ribbon domain-containing protein [Sphingorhabdus sp. Alg231-15]|uniref:zinc ribbon domain-containing protein n=1 Tax=Sphingorhabdus sp. Alg231-15 TaxID=1922222 RepID=UPI000D553C84